MQKISNKKNRFPFKISRPSHFTFHQTYRKLMMKRTMMTSLWTIAALRVCKT